ncbi:MAG: transcriptional regulator [Gammaproteobacteria bacterium]|nr:transcriptional regulator [Gammaproteobacteria bacterium]
MGTYYALGVVKELSCQSSKPISISEWEKIANKKIDISLFDFNIENENNIKCRLKDHIFKNNIENFYLKLKEITQYDYITDYFDIRGTDIENYKTQSFSKRHDEDNVQIWTKIEHIPLFIEGKVLAEEFSIEPALISWLFRNSNFGNVLAGCVVSSIIA